MSETRNIEEMAKVLSEPIFTIFGWQKVGPENTDWACVEADRHRKKTKKTHPSDVVFKYHDPYLGSDVYLNTDLKSYASQSIDKSKLEPHMRSLAQSVECANKSSSWAELYAVGSENWQAHGLLFVYNHDGDYDRSFDALLTSIQPGDVPLLSGQRVYVLGPSQIEFLDTIATDIASQRGLKLLPNEEHCGFYYPDLEEAKVQTKKVLPFASIDLLLGPWIVLRYHVVEGVTLRSGYYFYYRGLGETMEEFEYVLDYIFNYQLLEDYDKISVRMPFAVENAPAVFARAKRRYQEEFWPLAHSTAQGAQDRLSRITFNQISAVKRRFSAIALGM